MRTFGSLVGVQSWKPHATAVIRKMTAAKAQAALTAIAAETKAAGGGGTIFHPTIRAITGGYNSQSINFWVVRLLHERKRKP